MPTIFWTGKSAAVAQVSRVQIGANDASTTYSLTVNGVSVSVTGAASAEATATALAAAWNDSTHPYFTPVSAAVDSSASPSTDITLTADEGGFPFTVTSSASGGAGSSAHGRATCVGGMGSSRWSSTFAGASSKALACRRSRSVRTRYRGATSDSRSTWG